MLVRSAMAAWAAIGVAAFREEAAPEGYPLAVLNSEGDSCYSEPYRGAPIVHASVHPRVCRTPAVRLRVIGNLFGLPLLHQRADRDRYVVVPAGSSCPGGEVPIDFWGRCDDSSEVIGLFDNQSIMAAGVPLARRDGMGSVGGATTPSRRDRSAGVELASIGEGWSPFQPIVSADPGSDRPLILDLAPGVPIKSGLTPAVLAVGDALRAFATGADGGLYSKSFDAGSWQPGYWDLLVANFGADPAVARLDDSVHLARVNGNTIEHLVHDGADTATLPQIEAPSGLGELSVPSLATGSAGQLSIAIRRFNRVHVRSLLPELGEWTDIGCCFTGAPVLLYDASEQLQIFAADQDGYLNFKASLAHPWASLGSYIKNGTSPAVVQTPTGQRVALVRGGNDDLLWWKREISSGWSAFSSSGGLLQGGPAAARTPDGTVHVLGNIEGSGVWHRTFRE